MQVASQPLLWCLRTGPQDSRTGKILDVRETGRTPRSRLLCAQCRHAITSHGARIEILGQHEHTCANPHGYAFHIGCFADAPGCVAVGRAESAFSWFPGYTWKTALCSRCHAHLGWEFGAATSRFHGLILARLVAEDPDSSRS